MYGATGGVCIVATPALVIAGAVIGATANVALGEAADLIGWNLAESATNADNGSDPTSAAEANIEDARTPDLTTDLTGKNPRESSGKRVNTDLPGGSQDVFDSLSGGKSTTQDDGTQVAPNGVRLRPGRNGNGPRIDIPGNGPRPPETIHFPPGG